MTDLAAMPRDFDGLLVAVPDGFSISERVVEPVALLSRVSGKISVRLGGKRTVRGEVRLIEAPSVSHAWIADGAVLRPLPKDAPGLVAKCLGDEFPDDISYATAIRLLRSPPEGLEVEAAPDILHSGKIAAEELPPEIDINANPFVARIAEGLADLRVMAIAAVDRVLAEKSELKDLWEEGDSAEWLAAVDDLRRRLLD